MNISIQEHYAKYNKGDKLPDDFTYTSDTHKEYLSKEELLDIIKNVNL
jgi:hypothetical protein